MWSAKGHALQRRSLLEEKLDTIFQYQCKIIIEGQITVNYVGIVFSLESFLGILTTQAIYLFEKYQNNQIFNNRHTIDVRESFTVKEIWLKSHD